ncbi:hypothetical protein [Tianweitania sp.]|uniref:hypothetical protein n=1 Tax=Tianweitania sp. TaxID=2021634 RepID=UPI00289B6617|nr:hypothetical protein [Tianweitania sp.]
MMIWRRFFLAAAGLLSCGAASAVELNTPLAGGDEDLTLFGPRLEAVQGAPVPLPPGSSAALETFAGTLVFSESRLGTTGAGTEVDARLDKDPLFFPAVRLRFSTLGSDLVPATQETIRIGSLPGDAGYWDVKVALGKVWSDPADGGWSRASFPFALVSPSGEISHHGHATFRYRGREISPVSYRLFSLPNEDAAKSFAAAGVLMPRLDREIFSLPED